MQVFQDEHDGLSRAHGLQCIVELTEHARGCDAYGATLQRAVLGPSLQRRELCKPCGCVLAQSGEELLVARMAAQPGQRFEQRLIRFAGAVTLHAFAARDAHTSLCVNASRAANAWSV